MLSKLASAVYPAIGDLRIGIEIEIGIAIGTAIGIVPVPRATPAATQIGPRSGVLAERSAPRERPMAACLTKWVIV